MHPDIARILISRDKIAQRVKELADEIARTYEGDADAGITVVTILSGALIFVADLMRQLPLKMKVGLIMVSSYAGPRTSPSKPKVIHGLNTDVAGRHVLLVDDILDTGGTLRMVRRRLEKAGARSIRTCVLLRKPAKAPPDVGADFIGFDIEDAFVVGYGLDFDDQYRNLPDIAVLREEIYARRNSGAAEMTDSQAPITNE
ncbi:MAG TPA: hypoxanthine phosphoribosyltransferase [Phycisphaerae bacterium]|nr:hypoxanthine phosphoribosyltransferase [Phycisphaerae bacterium]HRR85793.1 hypoxanthine phosphoribosyltransferase [Phycisphaerae bacterium]